MIIMLIITTIHNEKYIHEDEALANLAKISNTWIKVTLQ